MLKLSLRSYVFIFIVLLLLVSVPTTLSEKWRSASVAMLSPVQKLFSFIPLRLKSENIELQTELQQLNIQILHLKAEKEALEHLLEQEPRQNLPQQALLSQEELPAVPARVIFRSPIAWNSSLWLNVGKANNEKIGQEVVAKYSPVVLGNAVVGMVDYVGKHQCRVRLITDSGLTPSVRAVRGAEQNHILKKEIKNLSEHLTKRDDLFPSIEEKRTLLENLETLKAFLGRTQYSWHLAKGELRGSGKPLWRKRAHLLQGTGFNYDFQDKAGPARDLRTGRPLNATEEISTLPLLQVHDLLMTTGMDGVFPPGLSVAEVTKVHTLKEGDYFYEIEAKPMIKDMDELSLVFVLPPVGFDKTDQPSPRTK